MNARDAALPPPADPAREMHVGVHAQQFAWQFEYKNPAGGMHHACYEVDDIIAARDRLRAAGARVLGDGEPHLGAHDKPVLFLHPKDFCGTLIELEQA